MEINPEHPVTKAMNQQWHTVAVILMRKMGEDHVVVTKEDVEAIGSGEIAVVAQELSDGLHLRIVDMETGLKMARGERGIL